MPETLAPETPSKTGHFINPERAPGTWKTPGPSLKP